jgi:hypothetical protein
MHDMPHLLTEDEAFRDSSSLNGTLVICLCVSPQAVSGGRSFGETIHQSPGSNDAQISRRRPLAPAKREVQIRVGMRRPSPRALSRSTGRGGRRSVAACRPAKSPVSQQAVLNSCACRWEVDMDIGPSTLLERLCDWSGMT